MIVEELVGRIGLETHGFDRATAALKQVRSLHAAFGAIGGVMFAAQAAFQALTVSVADEVGDLEDFGNAVGISVQGIQALGAAAIPTGASMEDVTTGLRKLADSAANAAKGNESAQESFGALGISVFGANGRIKPLEQLLNEVSNGLSNLKDPAQQVGLAIDILGRGGVKLLPALRNGADSLANVRKEAERLGVVMSEDTVKRFSRVDNAFDGLKLRAQGFRNIIAKAFLPSTQKTLDTLTSFYDKNADKIEDIAKRIASVVTKPVTLIMDSIGAAGAFFAQLGPMTQGVLGLAGAFIALAVAMAIPAAPFLILAFLVAAVLEDIQNFRDGLPSLLGDVVKEFDNFKFSLEELTKSDNLFVASLAAIVRGITAVAQALGSLLSFDTKKIHDSFGELSDLVTGDSASLQHRRDRQAREAANPTPGEVVGTPGFSSFMRGLPGVGPFSNDTMEKAFASTQNPGEFSQVPMRDANPASVGAQVTVNVAAAPGMDEQALAEKVAAEVKNQMDFSTEEITSYYSRTR